MSDDYRALYYFSPDINSPRLQDPHDFDTPHETLIDEKKEVRFSVQSMDSSELSSIHEESEDEELLRAQDDLEAQKAVPPPSTQPAEYAISTSKKLTYLGLYFLLNLGVTLSNKALLRSVSCSPSPYTCLLLIRKVGFISLAAHLLAHLLHLHRLHHPPRHRPTQTLQTFTA